MRRDPIVEEIHRYREEYAARFNYDLDAICEDLREKQKQRGHKVVRLSPKSESAAVSDVKPAELAG